MLIDNIVLSMEVNDHEDRHYSNTGQFACISFIIESLISKTICFAFETILLDAHDCM